MAAEEVAGVEGVGWVVGVRDGFGFEAVEEDELEDVGGWVGGGEGLHVDVGFYGGEEAEVVPGGVAGWAEGCC